MNKFTVLRKLYEILYGQECSREDLKDFVKKLGIGVSFLKNENEKQLHDEILICRKLTCTTPYHVYSPSENTGFPYVCIVYVYPDEEHIPVKIHACPGGIKEARMYMHDTFNSMLKEESSGLYNIQSFFDSDNNYAEIKETCTATGKEYRTIISIAYNE